MSSQPSISPLVVGRYALHGEIAHGGMATIHVGRLMGPAGFVRTVAIKRLHPNFARDPRFVSMFIDEARLAARIHHPNVVSIIDVVAAQGELLLVMDYVPGDSLSQLLAGARRAGRQPEAACVVKMMLDVLAGLHAAHEARSEHGHNLGIVHRDVSPQNVLVGVDGVAHVIDFGVAKAAGRIQTTQDGQLKGKLAYMAPEQIRSSAVDRRTDLYAAAVVLWEALAGRRLFDGNAAELMYKVLEEPVQPPSVYGPGISPRLDKVVLTGLQRDPARRYATALQMAEALEQAQSPSTNLQVARWVECAGKASLQRRAVLVSEVESSSEISVAPWPDVPSATSPVPSPPGESPPLRLGTGGLGAGEPGTDASSTISSASVRKPQGLPTWWVGAATASALAAAGVTVLFAWSAWRGAPGRPAVEASSEATASASRMSGASAEPSAKAVPPVVASEPSAAGSVAPAALAARSENVRTPGPVPPLTASASGKASTTGKSPYIRD